MFGPRALVVTYRLKRAARVRIDLLRGGKVVRHLVRASRKRAGRTYTLRVSPRGLAAGEYTVRLRARVHHAHAAGDTATVKRAVNVSPGATAPGERRSASGGAVIGSKLTTSSVSGANTCTTG